MKIEIFDSTLRDGAQSEGISFSVSDKINIVNTLDKFGVAYIEAGNPGSNPKDIEFFEKAAKLNLKNAKLCAFGSTHRKNTAVEDDPNIQSLLKAGTDSVAIFGKAWDLHAREILKVTTEENLALVRNTVAFFKQHGKEVIFDAEHYFDGRKDNADYAMAVLKAAADAGADVLCLCDTNGGAAPEEVLQGTKEAVEAFPGVRVGIHCHNDIGCAVASSMLAVQAGATHVQGTFTGIGERCGNADLSILIPNLQLKQGYECIENDLSSLTKTVKKITEISNMSLPNNKPYTGYSAFAHKGGIHVSAIMKDSKTYEHIDPELVGNQRRVLISELSGISNLLYKYKEMNLDIDRQNPESKRILEEIKQLENQGYQFEGADGTIELLLHKAHNSFEEPFSLEALRLLVEMKPNSPAYSEAVIKIRVGDQVVHTAAEGNGPVNALDNALRKSLKSFYPNLESMQLSDYKVRVLDEKDGTGASVRVHIETATAQDSWGTVGVSTNIIEASWQALADSIAYGLMNVSGTGKDEGTEPEIK